MTEQPSRSTCTAMEPEAWALVADLEACPHSVTQMQAAKEMGLPLKGAILCHLPEYADQEPCRKAPAFPLFCNVNTNKCFAGLRDTCELIQELETLNKSESANNDPKGA